MTKGKKFFLGIFLSTLLVGTGVVPAFASLNDPNPPGWSSTNSPLKSVTDIIPKSNEKPSSLSVNDPNPK